MREFLRDIPIIRKTKRNDRVIFHLIERSLKERKKEREIYARGDPDGMLEFPAKTKYRVVSPNSNGTCLSRIG